MPVAASAPQEPDWSGIRAAAVAVGVREAARQAAADLPPDEQDRFVERVMKRCSREGWLVKAEQARTITTAGAAKPMSALVRNGADSLSNSLAENYLRSKVGQAQFLDRASTKLAQVPENELLLHAQTGKALADMASKVFPEQAGTIRLSMDHSPLLDVEMEIVVEEREGGM